MNRRTAAILLLTVTLLSSTTRALLAQAVSGSQAPQYLTAGIFLGRIELGERIFGPVRLLPFDHPESLGHEYPNQGALHTAEVEVLDYLGTLVGLQLRTTLLRYPAPPTDAWPYREWSPLPVEAIRGARVVIAGVPASLPSLRAVAFRDRFPLAFLLDSRNLTLAQRGMQRATSMGLDLTREQFLAQLTRLAEQVPSEGTVVIVFK